MAEATSDYELLTEHFSYPPVSLLDDIINTVNVLADRALDSVERLLISVPPKSLGFPNKAKPPSSKSNKAHENGGDDANDDQPSPADAAKAEIESGTHQLETLLNAAIDKNFDVFELYVMQNILTVHPRDQPYMRLSHYRDLDLAALENDSPDRPTPESVTALRRRVQASQKLHIALEAERARNQAFLEKLRGVLGLPAATALKREKLTTEEEEQQQEEARRRGGSMAGTETGGVGGAFKFLRDRGGLETGSVEKPLTTTTEFTLSQLQALRSLSRSLRTILPELKPNDAKRGLDGGQNDDDDDDDDDGGDNDGGKGGGTKRKSWRRDRMEYVEGSSRKYLERRAGLELGAQGEVRDGEWQGEGKELTRGEVEGLERMAGILGTVSGGGKASQGDGNGDGGGDEGVDEDEDEEMEGS